jgi:hypothetical protein
MFLPIMVKVRPSLSADMENQFTLMLVLDKQFSINTPPPLPTVDGVFTVHHPEQIYYARRFNGFAKEADWKRESSNLLDVCKHLTINSSEVISATYDMPTKLINRRNEVLVADISDNNSNETSENNLNEKTSENSTDETLVNNSNGT